MNLRPTSVYTLSELAEGLGISVRTIQRCVKAGELHTVRVGLHSFATGKNILSWLESGAEGSRTPKSKLPRLS